MTKISQVYILFSQGCEFPSLDERWIQKVSKMPAWKASVIISKSLVCLLRKQDGRVALEPKTQIINLMDESSAKLVT